MTRRSRPARPSFPFLLLAVLVVSTAYTAAAEVVEREADEKSPLPEIHISTAATLKTPTPPAVAVEPSPPTEAAPTPTPEPEATPAPYIPDETEVEMLARVIWGEARGVPSDMEKAAVVWCVLNRVDGDAWPDTVAEVVTQPNQFTGYSPDYPATEEHKALAADVLTRWERERREGGDVGRVLPVEYVFFNGDGQHNHFRTEYRGGKYWDWTLENPYDS